MDDDQHDYIIFVQIKKNLKSWIRVWGKNIGQENGMNCIDICKEAVKRPPLIYWQKVLVKYII